MYIFWNNPCVWVIFSLESIEFKSQKWMVTNNKGMAYEYEAIHFLVETGFFLLIEFSSPGTRKQRYLIFFDQLTTDENRKLHLLEKIT